LVAIEEAGEWNRLDGPDFKGARLRFDGELEVGDVEVHFREQDWAAHGHHEDPNYDRVILHLCLFPSAPGVAPAVTSAGREVPMVSLVDLLWYDLEEYASEDSIVLSAGTENEAAIEELLGMTLARRIETLRERARERWELKRCFASLRVERLGWRGACHASAMEIMGYAANRVPMLMVASRFSLEDLARGTLSVEEAIAAGGGKWKTRGSRPANHPHVRLAQYLDWVAKRPDWPERLGQLDSVWTSRLGLFSAENGATARKSLELPRWKRRLVEDLTGGCVGGARFDTLMVDGFLPFLAARFERDLFELWFHWYAGNAPDGCLRSLRTLKALHRKERPLANGWVQGALRSGQMVAVGNGVRGGGGRVRAGGAALRSHRGIGWRVRAGRPRSLGGLAEEMDEGLRGLKQRAKRGCQLTLDFQLS